MVKYNFGGSFDNRTPTYLGSLLKDGKSERQLIILQTINRQNRLFL